MHANTQTSRLGATGLKVRTAIKGGRLSGNHSRAGSRLKVKAAIKGRGVPSLLWGEREG